MYFIVAPDERGGGGMIFEQYSIDTIGPNKGRYVNNLRQ